MRCDCGLIEPDTSRNHSTESRGYGMHGCVHMWAVDVLNEEQGVEMARLAIQCRKKLATSSNAAANCCQFCNRCDIPDVTDLSAWTATEASWSRSSPVSWTGDTATLARQTYLSKHAIHILDDNALIQSDGDRHAQPQ